MRREQVMTEQENECRLEVYNPEKMPWGEIREDILNIEASAFEGDTFGEELLQRDFEDSDNIVVLMRDANTRKIVGFTYAKPTVKTYPEDFPEREMSADTAYIYDTALEKSYQ